MTLSRCFSILLILAIASVSLRAERFPWQESHAVLLPQGELEYAPVPFEFSSGESRDKVWMAEVDFLPRALWMEEGDEIARLTLARWPNWRESDPNALVAD